METVNIRTPRFMEKMANALEIELTASAIKGQLLDITGLRGVGKTTTLVNFAKKYDLDVVTRYADEKQLIEQSGFSKIHVYRSSNYDSLRTVKRCVIDEGVDAEHLLKQGIKVVTGFFNRN